MSSINPIRIQKYLKNVHYPTNKAELIRRAEEQGADEKMRRTLEHLADREFGSPIEVSQAIARVK